MVVEINEPDAVVQVLNEEGRVEISRKGEGSKLSISVDPGRHRLKVEKNGFSLFTSEFEIESGREKVITARLEPLPKLSQPKAEPELADDPEKQMVDAVSEHSPDELQQPSPEAKVIEAQWTFDEGEGNVAKDSDRFGFHGTLKNMDAEDAWSEDVPPTKAQNRFSLKFDGVDDYVEVSAPAQIWATGTFAAWIKTQNAADDMGLFGTANREWRSAVCIAMGGVKEEAERISVYIRDSDTRLFSRYSRDEIDLRDGRWHHVGVTWNGTAQVVRIYVDGVSQDVVHSVEGSKGASHTSWTTPSGMRTSPVGSVLVSRHRRCPRGSWKDHRWQAMEVRAPSRRPLPQSLPQEARAEVVRRQPVVRTA